MQPSCVKQDLVGGGGFFLAREDFLEKVRLFISRLRFLIKKAIK